MRLSRLYLFEKTESAYPEICPVTRCGNIGITNLSHKIKTAGCSFLCLFISGNADVDEG